MMQSLYVIPCPTPGCEDYIFLPRQSLLGRFDNLQNRPTDDWPIKYLCQHCGQWFDHPAEVIRHQGVPVQAQNLVQDILVRYDFLSGPMNSLRRYWLYTKATLPWSQEQLVEHLLKPSGMWRESHGEPRY